MDKIYLALYSYGFDSRLSMEEKLQKTAEIGYVGVEYAGGYGELAAPDMKKLLKKFGLEAMSSHVQMDKVVEDLPYMAELGGKMIIVPGFPFSTKAEAIDCAELLNKNGREAAKYGIKVGYHNHTSEFYIDEGRPLLDYIIENTDPALVSIELDCGWASAAGINPVDYINQHTGRIIAVHVKENSKVIGAEKPRSPKDPSPWGDLKFDENGRPIFPEAILKMFEEHGKMNVPTGTGIVDWKAVKAAADAQGCLAYIVEREWSYNVPQDRVQCIKEDFTYLKNNI
jgi:sugar phosphate isomerase/epimerase